MKSLLERQGAYDTGFWALARDMGWPAAGVAEADGGLGLGLVETLIVAEECGRALASAPFLATGAGAAYAFAQVANRGDVLGGLASGDVRAALAFAEGAEVLPGRPQTRLAAGRLTGDKTAVLGAAGATHALVLAADDADAPVLAWVDLAASGVSRSVVDTIDNSRCLAHLRFDGAPATPLASEALSLASGALGRLALFLASEGVGGADACLALSVAYANERQAFGQPIGKFQAVKHSLAEIYVLNEMARASVLDAAIRVDRGDSDAEAFLAAARLNAVQAYETAAAAATQIHGGVGVTWEADLHLHYRRSRALATEAGAAPYWEDRIVAHLEAA
jgi:alkylation response protein AidB-like acyl-CoA dehydrogenase